MSNMTHRLSLRGWSMVLLLPVCVAIVWPRSAPQWTLMWGVAFSIYFGFKWLTWRRTVLTNSSALRQLTYLFAWPGMDAEAFLDSDRRPTTPPPTPSEVAIAGSNAFGGVILTLDPWGWFDHSPRWLFAWSGVVGYMLVLHFGVFRLLSCLLRWQGIDAVPIMNQPFAATSVASLWGQRWNTAFSDLIHRFWFRPLARPLGLVHATWIGFGVSGLIHEAVMSFPARGGYGLPTLYFLLQAGGILLERSRWGKSRGLGRGAVGWLFAMVCLIAPLPLFMNPAFFGNIVVPFFQALRGVS